LARVKGLTKKVRLLVPHTSKFTPPVPRIVIVAKTDWLKTHQKAATRYVETMLDEGRQWEKNSASWVNPAQKIWNSGLNDAQLTDAWRQFRSGGYFTINGGVNFAATQKIMNLFFKIRHEKPNQYVSKPADIYDLAPLRAALSKMGVAKGTPDLPDTPDWYKSNGMAAR
jgi:ABC-type nitrate/sulfonate/bicarbonate transport system substrate-binding protein